MSDNDDKMRSQVVEAIEKGDFAVCEDTEDMAVRENDRFEVVENRRTALTLAVQISHHRPTIQTTEQVFELAEEFFQWIQK